MASRPDRLTRARFSHQDHLMPSGQSQAQTLTTGHQIRQTATSGEEIVEELKPLGLLAPGDGQMSSLEALGGGCYRIVGGPKNSQPRSAQGRPGPRRDWKFPPQPPCG